MENYMKNLLAKKKMFGPLTERIDFSKSAYNLPITDLLEVQKSSFDWFIKEGIDEAFKNVYPIVSNKGKFVIEFLRKRVERPKDEFLAINDSRAKSTNFAGKLYATLRWRNEETGETKTSEVLFGELPLMTRGGSFIINGSEKIIISQLVRSPGIYFQKNIARVDKGSGGFFNYGKLIPLQGAWIEMLKKISVSASKKGVSPIEVRIDKNRKIVLTTLLRALGMEDKDIVKFFGQSKEITSSLERDKFREQDEALKHIYTIVRPGDRSTEKTRKELFATTLFNKKRYNLSKIGRFTITNKLNIIDRIRFTYLAEDLRDKNKEILFAKNTYIDIKVAKQIHDAFIQKTLPLTKLPISKEVYAHFIKESKGLSKRLVVVKVKVKKEKASRENIIVIGNDPFATEEHLLVSDLIAIFSYFVNLNEGLGLDDDVDSLWNKRIRGSGELLQNQLQIGLLKLEKHAKERMATKDASKLTLKNITNNKAIVNALKVFFNSSQLSQFMDQINPLSSVSNKRRITSLGPTGLSRDIAQFDVRDINSTHYGRICPIETPEGPNIGLILNFATYGRLNKFGFIETPYFKVEKGKVDPEPVYLTAKEELGANFAQSTVEIRDGKLVDSQITCRQDGQYIIVDSQEVDYIDVSSKQFCSIASACIPFLENDDANRALMGANMQRQAVPLIAASAPYVATGIEADIAKYAATNLVSEAEGEVLFADGKNIKVKHDKRIASYKLRSFERSNQGTLICQKPIVKKGDKVQQGTLLTDGPSFDNGEMAIGQNVLVGFSTWNGYNYEDAIILSERLVKDDVFTSIHVEKYSIKFRKSKIGEDILTTEIPNVSNASKRFLDETGIVRIGSEVTSGDILVGRISPKVEENITPEEKLLQAIFLDRSKTNKDTSLKVKREQGGTVIDVEILSRENGDKLDDGVEKIVTIFIAQKRKISVGDKMAGRHGNKGVISRILPVEDMPHLDNGTPLDIMLNPLGVPSRMNIGQVLELHLGLIAKVLNVKFATPIFDGAKLADIRQILESKEAKAAKLSKDGKYYLTDGITGRKFDKPIAVGIMYMLKLSHMVYDKMHARSVGPYSLITQQPLGGKAQNGGQRFGEMEVWALESYGASKILQEILTYKSDDINGRNKIYNAIVNNSVLPSPGVPESFNVLTYELAGLGLKTSIIENSSEQQFEPEIEGMEHE